MWGAIAALVAVVSMIVGVVVMTLVRNRRLARSREKSAIHTEANIQVMQQLSDQVSECRPASVKGGR